jgi:hypothetical protein
VEPGKNSRRIVGNRFVKFWLDDLPPFSGKMRAVFYGGLLVLALTQTSPITLASPLAGSDPALHIPVELVRWSNLGSLDGNAILFLRNLCLAAWICAAAGLFTGPAKLATALTLLPLHALSIGIHNSHGWYVPAKKGSVPRIIAFFSGFPERLPKSLSHSSIQFLRDPGHRHRGALSQFRRERKLVRMPFPKTPELIQSHPAHF